MLLRNYVVNVREAFVEAFQRDEFVIDKTGVKTIEIINASFIANEEKSLQAKGSDRNPDNHFISLQSLQTKRSHCERKEVYNLIRRSRFNPLLP